MVIFLRIIANHSFARNYQNLRGLLYLKTIIYQGRKSHRLVLLSESSPCVIIMIVFGWITDNNGVELNAFSFRYW